MKNFVTGILPFCTLFVCFESKAQLTTITWESTNSGNSEVRVLRSTSSNIVFAGTNQGVFKSADEGLTWINCTYPQMQTDIEDIYISVNDEIWVGTRSGLFLSSDTGNTWTVAYSSDTASEVRRIIVDRSGKIFIGVQDSASNGSYRSVFVSQDTGQRWTEINDGIMGFSRVNSFLTDTSGLVYALAGSGLIEYDILYSWDSLNQLWSFVYSFAPSVLVNNIKANDNNVFVAATGVFMMMSYDAGISWSYGGLYYNNCVSLDIRSDSTVIAGTTWNGVYVSYDLGNTWNQDTIGLPQNPLVPALVDPILSLCSDTGGRLFAGTRDSGIYRSTQLVTSARDGEGKGTRPNAISLLQNYPNPFNPFTTIKFDLPISSDVRLSVYDLLGREVAVLVNEMKEAGYHQVTFDASDLSSGVYFYRLQAGDVVQTRRLLLLR
jgi:photosystem II stability/assembly factor-like uncharacterized protein